MQSIDFIQSSGEKEEVEIFVPFCKVESRVEYISPVLGINPPVASRPKNRTVCFQFPDSGILSCHS